MPNKRGLSQHYTGSGALWCEFAMIHTFPIFEKLIKSRLNKNADEFVEQHYDLMGRYFQGKSQTKWSKVIFKVAVDNRSTETFLDAQRDYLEAITKVKNISDCIIRQLRDRAKPAATAFDNYVDQRDEWRCHADGDYLRKTLSMPNPQEWAEQIFSQQPKAHQLKYAEEHDSVERDMDKLKLFFNGCHTCNVGNGTYQKVLNNYRDAWRARLCKEKGKVSESGGNKTNRNRRREQDQRTSNQHERSNYEHRQNERSGASTLNRG